MKFSTIVAFLITGLLVASLYMPMMSLLGLREYEGSNNDAKRPLGQVEQVADGINFTHEIMPILQQNCVECHGGNKSKGKFSMNDRDKILNSETIDLEHPEKSLLLQLLRTHDEDDRMPPADSREDPLPEKEIALIEQWIAEGLPWEPGFSFAKAGDEAPPQPKPQALPKVSTSALPEGPDFINDV